MTEQELFLENNKEELLNILRENTVIESEGIESFDDADDFQAGYSCKTFNKDWSICFQNGDMNSYGKGEPCWTNSGANCGINELRDILIEREEFKNLIDEETYWSYHQIENLVNEFIHDIAERDDLYTKFQNMQEEAEKLELEAN